MNRSALTLSVFVVLVLCASVHASILAYDAFSYNDGRVRGGNGGDGWARGWAAAPDSRVDTMASPLTYTFPTGEVLGGGDNALAIDSRAGHNRDFDNETVRRLSQPLSGDVVYASFLFRDDSSAVGNDMCTMWLGSFAGPRFGMVGSSGVNKADDFGAYVSRGKGGAVFTGDLTLGQTHLIVARISKTKPGAKSTYNKIEMWIDPTIDDQDTPDVTASLGKGAVSRFSRIGFADTQGRNDSMYIDEVRLGTTWADVNGGVGEGVPEPVTAGLLLVGGLSILWRKRRRGC